MSGYTRPTRKLVQLTDVVAPSGSGDNSNALRFNFSGENYVFNVADSGGSGAQLDEANTFTRIQTIRADIADGVPGPNLLTNGDFATNSFAGWTENNAGFDASTGALVHTPGSYSEIAQDIALTVGHCDVRLVISGATAGTAGVYGDNNDFDITANADGEWTQSLDITATSDTLFLWASNDFDGSIDDVSVRQIVAGPSLVTEDVNGDPQLEVGGTAPNVTVSTDGNQIMAVDRDSGVIELGSSDLPGLKIANLTTSDPGDSGVWLTNGLMVIGDAPLLVRSDEDTIWTGTQTFATSTTFFPNLATDETTVSLHGLWNDSGIPKIISLDPTELLTNGDFETGDPPDSWPTINANAYADSTVHGGSQALRLEPYVANTGVSQSVILVPGKRYCASVWTKVTSGTSVLIVYDNDLAAEVGNVTSTLTDAYHQIFIDFVATSVNHTIWLQGVTDTDILLFDDASLRRVITVGEIDHAALSNLGFTESGHVDFAGTKVRNTFTRQQIFGFVPGDITPDTELLTNGDWATNDLTGWTDDASGFDASSGALVHTPGAEGNLTQDVVVASDIVCALIFSISGMTAGTVEIFVGGTSIDVFTLANGVFQAIELVTAGTYTVTISVGTSFDGQIDYVSFLPSLDGWPASVKFLDSTNTVVSEIRAGHGGAYHGLGAGKYSRDAANAGFGNNALGSIVDETGNAVLGDGAGSGARCNHGLFLGTNSGSGETVDRIMHIGDNGDIISGVMDSGSSATQSLKFHVAKINWADAPTSPSGLDVGDIYLDGDLLKVVLP